MRSGWLKTIAVLLVPVLAVTWCPGAAWADDFSDTSSEGAAITVGLLVAVVAVLFIISLKTDVNNVLGKAPSPAESDALAGRLSLVLEQQDFNRGVRQAGRGLETEVADLGLGVRVTF